MDNALIVVDVGKTHTKLSLMDRQGAVLAARSRVNARPVLDARLDLDASGMEEWLVHHLREFAKLATVGAIVPVAHGATAAFVSEDCLLVPVLDYETEIPPDIAEQYDRERDPFEETCSPRLPQGLNLGAQLFWQERLYPSASRANILLWPQFWAWRLCGERAAEVSSLGCHTDLWRPTDQRYSALAQQHGWDRRLGAIRPASAILGTLRPEIAAATGLRRSCEVLCGVHDSNAALNAARGIADLGGAPFVLVSTGTWFVAMQSGAPAFPELDQQRDTLANVDIEGHAVPSVRFMGGREYAAILGDAIGTTPTLGDAERLVAREVMTRPSFVPGTGPFPQSKGAIVGQVENNAELASLASLHLALMTHASLDLIAATGPIVIEGRFADDAVFPAALAALCPNQPVFRIDLADGIALGGARLKFPDLGSQKTAERVEPWGADMETYASQWRNRSRGV